MIYEQRLHKLQKKLQELECDALLVDDPINLYYLTGVQLSTGKLLVDMRSAHFLVDGRYFEMCRENCRFPVLLIDPKRNAFEDLLKQECHFIETLAFDSETVTYQGYTDLKLCVEAIRVDSHGTRLLDLKPLRNPVKKLRSLKDKSEIELLRAAGDLGARGFDHVCSLLVEGITELELAIELEIFWKLHGSKCLAFEPIIAFGANSSMPHYRAGEAKLKKGDSVLIDIGVNYRHYHSDMTRVVFFESIDPRILKIFDVVKQAQEEALALCRPGIAISALDDAARGIITSHGYGERFTHSLGHGVGLEIHEWPAVRSVPGNDQVLLELGMAITIEPGIYLPNIGGVRLEDTVVITESSYENLTNRSLEPVIIRR